MHPKERTKIHGSPGLALVETPDQNHSDAERPSNRKPTQKSNRKQGSKNIYSFHLISILISVFQEELEALRARLEKVDKERLELKQTNEKLESRVSLSNDLTSKSTEMSLTMGVKESKKICGGGAKKGSSPSIRNRRGFEQIQRMLGISEVTRIFIFSFQRHVKSGFVSVHIKRQRGHSGALQI